MTGLGLAFLGLPHRLHVVYLSSGRSSCKGKGSTQEAELDAEDHGQDEGDKA